MEKSDDIDDRLSLEPLFVELSLVSWPLRNNQLRTLSWSRPADASTNGIAVLATALMHAAMAQLRHRSDNHRLILPVSHYGTTGSSLPVA